MNYSFTAIVPTKERPLLLERALASIVQQTLLPHQIIVFDDGPNIENQAIVHSFKTRLEERVHVQYITTNGSLGVSMARNLASQQATGAWLAFLDDDDYWLPTHLQQIAEALHYEDLDFVVSPLRIDEDGDIRDGPQMQPEKSRRIISPTVNPGFMGSNIAIKKRVFDEIGGFDANLSFSEDLDLLLRLLDSNSNYSVLDSATAVYCRHSGPRLTTMSAKVLSQIQYYEQKHSHRMTVRDRMRMRRLRHLAAFRSETNSMKKAIRLASIVIYSDATDLEHTLRRRLLHRNSRRGKW